MVVGCGDNNNVDPRFVAQTYDEYTEPLSNALISTPEETTEIGPSGETTFVPAAVVKAPAVQGTGVGFWHFEDCWLTSPVLVDSSGFGANAQQPLNAACVAGISGRRLRPGADGGAMT